MAFRGWAIGGGSGMGTSTTGGVPGAAGIGSGTAGRPALDDTRAAGASAAGAGSGVTAMGGAGGSETGGSAGTPEDGGSTGAGFPIPPVAPAVTAAMAGDGVCAR